MIIVEEEDMGKDVLQISIDKRKRNIRTNNHLYLERGNKKNRKFDMDFIIIIVRNTQIQKIPEIDQLLYVDAVVLTCLR